MQDLLLSLIKESETMLSKETWNVIRDFLGLAHIRATQTFFIYILYFVLVNIVGYFIMKVDKQRAREGKQRIPENILFSVSILGGSLGTIIAMRKSRHKKKKRSFSVGIPVMLVVNIIMLAFLIYMLYMS